MRRADRGGDPDRPLRAEIPASYEPEDLFGLRAAAAEGQRDLQAAAAEGLTGSQAAAAEGQRDLQAAAAEGLTGLCRYAGRFDEG